MSERTAGGGRRARPGGRDRRRRGSGTSERSERIVGLGAAHSLVASRREAAA
ncbi:hypothetical protein [Micromonospora sp. CB01531]|uniref:hypothetical protein n=1 Tax=Micromonospora sp. CB01531 TaxID=1718947 RepID=UPI000A8E3B54|nr:hypothetical protein [Micromonospora sp. CB01531]